MKKLLVTATALAAFAAVGTAGAADLPPAPAYKAPMAAPVVVPSWTGCYVDGGIGYGMWNLDHYTETYPGLVQLSESQTDGGRGWLGRVGVGCDYQFPNSSFVIGAFGDYDFMSLKGTNSDPNVSVTGGTFPATAASVTETSAWYAGGRIGYLPYPNLMTFVSGGWTQTQFGSGAFTNITVPSSPLTGAGFNAQTYSGWFVGGGYEYRIPWASFNGLYWKTEYRFADYSAVDVPHTITATGALNGYGQNREPYVQTVTTSLVWKFSWGGPVVAKY
ncbi:MAG TPA: porin family protein [Xanthobacteraceae bacterium]|nr:porin family protein [Xanthobacteraceae bacterium]